MTGSSIFLDTAPIIYFLEKVPDYYDVVMGFLSENENARFVTSVVTVAEYFPIPYRNNLDLIDGFNAFIDSMGVSVVDIDRRVAEKAAKIRAEYPAFKGMDSLQLAAATIYGCDLLLTNDKQLRQYKELRCIAVADL